MPFQVVIFMQLHVDCVSIPCAAHYGHGDGDVRAAYGYIEVF